MVVIRSEAMLRHCVGQLQSWLDQAVLDLTDLGMSKEEIAILTVGYMQTLCKRKLEFDPVVTKVKAPPL